MRPQPHYKDILTFWFETLLPPQWWQKDPAVDEHIRQHFGAIHLQASQGELYEWRNSAAGALAEILILDQFSRNLYRNDARSFASDGMALVLAQAAISREFDKKLPITQRVFLYLPFMHSESRHIHEQAQSLFASPGMEQQLAFELEHAEIIHRFGRYPHRNRILGRESTTEELAFLTTHSGF